MQQERHASLEGAIRKTATERERERERETPPSPTPRDTGTTTHLRRVSKFPTPPPLLSPSLSLPPPLRRWRATPEWKAASARAACSSSPSIQIVPHSPRPSFTPNLLPVYEKRRVCACHWEELWTITVAAAAAAAAAAERESRFRRVGVGALVDWSAAGGIRFLRILSRSW